MVPGLPELTFRQGSGRPGAHRAHAAAKRSSATGLERHLENARVLAARGLLGLGGGPAISPGLLLAALSVRRHLVGAALALVQLLRLIVTYVAGPAALRLLTTSTAEHSPAPDRTQAAPFVQQGAPAPASTSCGRRWLPPTTTSSDSWRSAPAWRWPSWSLSTWGARIRPHPPHLDSNVEHGEPALRQP